MYVIGEQEQWRLLIGVCQLFESDLCWESTNSSHVDGVVVKETGDLLKSQIRLIKILVPAGRSLSETAYDDFIYKIHALLASLETLLQDSIKDEGCYQPRDGNNNAGEERYTPTLRRRCPKLVALNSLLRSASEQDITPQLSRFIHLRQNACEFKRTRIDVERFNGDMIGLLNSQVSERRIRAAKPASTPRRSKISDPYCSQSRRLFDSLVAHVQPCTINTSRHNAMIQLKHTDDQENQEGDVSHLDFCMLFGSCPDQIGDWIQAHCTSSPKDENEYAEHVYNICQNARHARDNGQVFRVRLIETRFLDVSDFDCMLRDPKAVPTVSLRNLLTNNILKDRYKFFPNDKKILAYTLSHALLNLHDNPWLQTLWTLDKIFFLQSHETGMLYNIHQPYVSCLLSTDAPPLETLDPLHNYPMVFSFAKLLWELETGEEMLAVKQNKNGQQSLWVTLRHLCCTASKHQFSLGYSRALDACVNFPKYVNREKTTTQDLKMAEKQAILKYIVHELESDVDLTRKAEWGTRDLNLKLQITVRGLPFEVDAVQPIVKTRGNSGTQFATMQEKERSVQKGELPRSPQQSLADVSKDAREVYALGQGRSTYNLSIPPSVSSSSSSSTHLHSTEKARSERRKPLKRSSDHFELQSPRKSAKLSGSTTIFPASKSKAPLASGQGRRQQRSSKRCNLHEQLAEIHVEESYGETKAGFGHMELLSATDPRSKVSSESFAYLNDMVSQHWQPWPDKDKVIRVAVLDTGFDWKHDDFQLQRTKTFTGEYQNIANPEYREKTPQASRVKECYNFCPDQDDDDVSDVDGHGTQVAGIILRLAPHAELYVARVCTGDRNRGKSGGQPEQLKQEQQRPDPDVIEKAIHWAIENKVHIINLSLGFRDPETGYIRKLREKLHQVQNDHHIVVFAATSNQGAHEPVAWPASSLRCAIGVHSCNDTGRKPSPFSAYPTKSHDAANFMVVGEKILSQWPSAKGGGFRVATGTSFATPVASAIGALVLQFVYSKRCTKHRERVEKSVFLQDLHTNLGMTKVLKAISTEHIEGYDIVNTKLFWANLLSGHDAIDHAWHIIERALAN